MSPLGSHHFAREFGVSAVSPLASPYYFGHAVGDRATSSTAATAASSCASSGAEGADADQPSFEPPLEPSAAPKAQILCKQKPETGIFLLKKKKCASVQAAPPARTQACKKKKDASVQAAAPARTQACKKKKRGARSSRRRRGSYTILKRHAWRIPILFWRESNEALSRCCTPG